MQKQGKVHWTQEEIDFLVVNSGSQPFPQMIKSFSKWSAKHGYPIRSESAIVDKMIVLSLSRRCTEDNFTVYELARCLGLPVDRIRRFVRSGKLQSIKIANNQWAISRKKAIELILNNPGHFSRCDRDNLFWLLENDHLVEQVKNTPPSTRGYKKAVRCYLPDGSIKVYSGIKEAARENYIAHSCIAQSIARKNGKSAGKRWEYC